MTPTVGADVLTQVVVPYRILVTGWRAWPRQGAYVVRRLLDAVAMPMLSTGFHVVVREGQCPYGGVDEYAYEWVIGFASNRVDPDRVPAKWQQFGKAAGAIRNQDMVNMGADICLGFPGPPTRKRSGTVDCMERAAKAGILVVSVPWADWMATDPGRFEADFYLRAAGIARPLF